MEKLKATYILADVKASFTTPDALRMTGSARRDAAKLGFSPAEIVEVIQGMTPLMLYKSMTTFDDHTVWQDVYHVPSKAGTLYVKFQQIAPDMWVVAFKEK
jgi:motility quorum-sensing regulator/GCU-specific mRNA interferase toxin